MRRVRAIGMLALLALAPSVPATTLTVGPSGCDFSDLPQALLALATLEGSHELHLVKGHYALPDGVRYAPQVAQSEIVIEGGYASCASPTPDGDVSDENQLAVLDGAGGQARSVLTIVFNGNPSRVTLRRVVLTGGDATDVADLRQSTGGGLQVIGAGEVVLGLGSRVRDNAATHGGGVALMGSPVNRGSESARADLVIEQGARVSRNTATSKGGGIYCGGTFDAAGPIENMHGSIILRDGVIEENVASSGGAFYCMGSSQAGGGFRPKIPNASVGLIRANLGNCASGYTTFDRGEDLSSSTISLGAEPDGDGVLSISGNSGSMPALCVFGNFRRGTDVNETVAGYFLSNVVISDQVGTGALAVFAGDGALIHFNRSGDHARCERFHALGCSAAVRNRHTGPGSLSSLYYVYDGQINLYNTLIADNDLMSTMFGAFGANVAMPTEYVSLDATVVINNTIGRVNDGTATLAKAHARGGIRITQSTILFATPLDAFFELQQIEGRQAIVEASILASSADPAPANVIPVESAHKLTRRYCGFFQRVDDFADHQVVIDPDIGQFVVLAPSSLVLDPIDLAPRNPDLVDACPNTNWRRHVDYRGAPYPYVMKPDAPVHGDIGAVEAVPPEFGDGFESATAR